MLGEGVVGYEEQSKSYVADSYRAIFLIIIIYTRETAGD